MQEKDVVKKIDKLVETIYSPDQTGINEKFIDFLGGLEVYLATPDKSVQGIEEVLKQIEMAYGIKDYIALADILLYELKPLIE